MHTIIHQERSDVGGIVHTHSLSASTFASLNKPIPASHYLITYAGQKVPVAGYEPSRTEELGQVAMETMGKDHDAVLLKNHGVIVVGETGEETLEVALTVKYCDQIHYQALNIGEPEIMDENVVNDFQTTFKESYGQQ